MKIKLRHKIYILCFFYISVLPYCFAYSCQTLKEAGKVHYYNQNYEKAIHEFKKALLINSGDGQAKEYLNLSKKKLRKIKVTKALDSLENNGGFLDNHSYQANLGDKDSVSKKESNFKLTGGYQLSFGLERDDAYYKRANFNLNELNWRILSGSALNNYENTYDPSIYNRLRFQVKDETKKGFGFYTDIDISPWSFIGKSDQITVDSNSSGDTATFQLKYWSNSGYTLNESVRTNITGDVFSLPELKVVNYRTLPHTVSSFWDSYTIPETEIHQEFWPLRELSFFYKPTEDFHAEIFPVGLQDKAYTSDDPLGLSNHHIYWEESPWLDSWQEGNYNSSSGDFFQGFWDDSLSFVTRDSTGERLTNLRGFSLSLNSLDSDLDFTFASPKTLWQDYDDYDNLEGAVRAKHWLNDMFMVGGTYAFKLGYNSQKDRDAVNQVLGLDFKSFLFNNTRVAVGLAHSKDEKDIQTSFVTDQQGNALRIEIINSSLDQFINKYYDQIKPQKDDESLFYKSQISLTHMDQGFDPGLSNYSQTKNDMFWSRHIYFRPPLEYYYRGLYPASLSWDDIAPFRIGDGIDSGRDVARLRLEFYNLFDSKLDTLFDVRNVHHTSGKFIENVVRVESEYRATPKLTAKILGIHQKLPSTTGGLDPFLYDNENNTPYKNVAVEDGKDPSLKTVALGAEYKLFSWLIPNLVWEYTNDATLAYDNFPRGVYNSTYIGTFPEEGFTSRREVLQLYRGSFFSQPPYSYYDIFKAGVLFKPREDLNVYIDWTRNEFEWAQLIDDNSNHIGVELTYTPLEKLGFHFKYTYTRANDISELNDKSEVVKKNHHNFFSELRYRINQDSEFIAQYGVGGVIPVGIITTSPFGGSLQTLDTQHIVRAYYRQKF